MEPGDSDTDPERLIQCPYNKHHQIRAYRFPFHLVKCRRSCPEVAKQFATCPFNARHLVPKAKLRDHITTCSDKRLIEEVIEVNEPSSFQREPMDAVSTWEPPPCDEDWESELSEQSDSPFIWGVTNSGIKSSSITTAWKNYLPPRVRVPKTLPYSFTHGKAEPSGTSVKPSL